MTLRLAFLNTLTGRITRKTTIERGAIREPVTWWHIKDAADYAREHEPHKIVWGEAYLPGGRLA